MNIVYIHRTKGRGVEGVHINEIVDQLRKQGNKVTIVAPVTGDVAKESTTSKNLSLMDYVPEFVFELFEIAYNIPGFLKIKKLSRHQDIDLIYERYSIFNMFSIFYAKMNNIDVVLEVNYTSQMPLVRKRNKLLKPLAKLFDKYVFKNSSRLIAVSSYLRDHLINEYKVSEEKVLVIPNAADPDKFNYVDYDFSQPQRIIGFVGGFYPWHGVDFLVESFREIVSEFPDARLMLVGDGPERSSIEKMVKEYNIEELVTFTGKVDHSVLSKYISNFYIGVMPDSNLYGSPMKILEYMSMGVPVVSPDYPPIIDIIDDNKEGLIFRRQDKQELVSSLKRLISDEGLRDVLSQNARQKIINERNWENNARLSIDGFTSQAQPISTLIE